LILSIQTRRVSLGQKTISRNCPFKELQLQNFEGFSWFFEKIYVCNQELVCLQKTAKKFKNYRNIKVKKVGSGFRI
jgi:hypothetical protein